MSTESDPLLSLDDVEVHYDDRTMTENLVPDELMRRFGQEPPKPVRAVDGVNLDIHEDDVVALVGESGSGKTTLGKTAIGLQQPTGGSVKYRGHDIWDIKAGRSDTDLLFEDVRQALQIIHQDPGSSLNPYRTIKANLSEPLKRWQPELDYADRQERMVTLLDRAGVTPAEDYIQRYPHQLSGGEKQRVVLVRALLMEPDLILADEAVSALDVSLRVEIMDLMLELQDEFDTSFLFISHNLSDARYFANKAGARIAVMYLGQIVEIGPSEQVIQNPQHPYTRLLRWASADVDPELADSHSYESIPVRELDVPDPRNPPSGCRFQNRCPEARAACQEDAPSLFDAGANGHQASCFRMLDTHEYWTDEYIDESTARRFEEIEESTERAD